jgi:hypothetical protein
VGREVHVAETALVLRQRLIDPVSVDHLSQHARSLACSRSGCKRQRVANTSLTCPVGATCSRLPDRLTLPTRSQAGPDRHAGSTPRCRQDGQRVDASGSHRATIDCGEKGQRGNVAHKSSTSAAFDASLSAQPGRRDLVGTPCDRARNSAAAMGTSRPDAGRLLLDHAPPGSVTRRGLTASSRSAVSPLACCDSSIGSYDQEAAMAASGGGSPRNPCPRGV